MIASVRGVPRALAIGSDRVEAEREQAVEGLARRVHENLWPLFTGDALARGVRRAGMAFSLSRNGLSGR